VGISSVFVSFVQTNDLMTEPRTNLDKLWTLMAMADAAPDTRILLCNDDASALTGEHVPHSVVPDHLRAGICVAPGVVGLEAAAVDGCGCVMMADPFTINESCTMGCRYCYAADKSLSDAKRNTTRRLPLVK
jgi:sulfatase maturation enzyme AslB (radical SAM superfamily)